MKTNTASPQDISAENIAVAAYHRWLAAGKPSGRDHEFWLKAESDLRKMVSQTPQASRPSLGPHTERQPHQIAPARPAIVAGGQRDKHSEHRSHVMTAV
jgi:hypothetical protein